MGKMMALTGNLDSKVREALRQKILDGEMDGGYHLSELKISKDYSVSRTPVREALCALAADGLVEMVPHRGAFVTHVPASTKLDQLQAYSLFIGLAAKLAAEKASIEALLDLENAFAFISNDTMSTADYLKALLNAMETLEKTAASPTVTEAVLMVQRRTNLPDVWALAIKERKELNLQLATLLTALKRKKGDVAEKTMRQLASIAITAWLGQRKLVVKDEQPAEDASTPFAYSRTRAAQSAFKTEQ